MLSKSLFCKKLKIDIWLATCDLDAKYHTYMASLYYFWPHVIALYLPNAGAINDLKPSWTQELTFLALYCHSCQMMLKIWPHLLNAATESSGGLARTLVMGILIIGCYLCSRRKRKAIPNLQSPEKSQIFRLYLIIPIDYFFSLSITKLQR